MMSSQLLMQMMRNAGMIRVGETGAEQQLFRRAQKLLGLTMTVVSAVSMVAVGNFGNQLGTGVSFLIVVQLVFTTFIVMLLDEMLQHGYGIGSGMTLFNATNICASVVWKTLSLQTVDTRGRGFQFEGAAVALVHLVATRTDKQRALSEVFFRSHLPNVSGLIATLAVALVVVYLQGLCWG